MAVKIKEKKILGSEKVRWLLTDLFKGLDDPKLSESLNDAEKMVKTFQEKWKGKVSSLTAEALKGAFEEKEVLITPIYKVSQYVHLLSAVDTQDIPIKQWVSKVDEAVSRFQNELLFFELELGSVSHDVLSSWIKDETLKNYTYRLQQVKDKARYYLTEKEERMVNLKDLTGADSYKKLYEDITASFEFEFEIDGQKQILNGSELRALRQHEDKSIRRKAMRLFYSRYEENQLLFTHIYNQVVKDYNIERKLRGYKTSFSVMNRGNDLDDKTIEVLHEVTTESYSLVQRYYRLKAKLLKLDDLSLADIYAPLPESAKIFDFNTAKEIVLDSFQEFDSTFYNLAKEMFDENRIDAPVLSKKRGGAFCSSSTPDIKPYVLLNFLGRTRDISTISHELGHAIHAMLSKKQPLWSYHAILPLCETASVFSEMILMSHLQKEGLDKQTRIALITDKLEDLFATSHRQNMFSRFEIACHARMTDGLMSTQELCDLYQSELKSMFGSSVKYPEEYKWEWATIPHIVSVPFYVHSYNFGNLLVLALYQQYLEEGKAFIPKLKNILSMGSFASPADIVRHVGVDLSDKAFWKKSVCFIESLLDELDVLCAS